MGDNEAVLDMTSMIDVVFLLLIFFMCATKFREPEGVLKTYLPRNRGGNSGSAPLKKGCRITLGRNGATVIAQADEKEIDTLLPGQFEKAIGVDGSPSLDQIERHIADRRALQAELPIIIDFAPDTPWHYVIGVVNICKKLGLTDVAFAAPEIDLK